MEQEYLIDTNVVIDYMSERFSNSALDFLDNIVNTSFYLSIINKIEILGFKNLSSNEEKQFQSLIRASNIILLNDDIVDETIALRKKYSIKLPDAVIAASAISINAILITGNIEDFNKLATLKLLDPNIIK